MNRFTLQRLPVLVLNSDAAPSRLQAIDPAIQDFWFTRGFRDYLVGSLPFVIRLPMKIDRSPTITPNNRVLRIELAKLPNSRLNGKEYH